MCIVLADTFCALPFRHLQINTFMIKTELYAWMNPERRMEIVDVQDGVKIGARKVQRITLPEDVDDEWIEQSKNEALSNGKRAGEQVWVKTGPNHFADCNTYALAMAYNLDPFQRQQTAEEYRPVRRVFPPSAFKPPPSRFHDYPRGDPAMG